MAIEYTDISQANTFELADAGMNCLTEQFGVVGAEAFIPNYSRNFGTL